MFERQRLPRARFVVGLPGSRVDAEPLRALLSGMVPTLAGARGLRLHVFAPDETGAASLARTAARLERRLRELWGELADLPPLPPVTEPDTPPEAAGRDVQVWQLCVVPAGVWSALAPASELVDARPGGVHRMVRDDAAPSRSYLKVEEALSHGIEIFGSPRPRERVIDLGAAPGGWSYAFLKRGCDVLAVDNGPLKVAGLEQLPGSLTHLRTDGLRLKPPRGWVPTDWLLCDMLVPPGVCLGLLRKWIEAGWMHRCIVNVKLPQREPLVALRPLLDYLAQVPGLVWRVRQLYHDRREVTVLARLPAAAGRTARTRDESLTPARRTTPRGPRKPGRQKGGPRHGSDHDPGRSGSGKPAISRRKRGGTTRGRSPGPPSKRRR